MAKEPHNPTLRLCPLTSRPASPGLNFNPTQKGTPLMYTHLPDILIAHHQAIGRADAYNNAANYLLDSSEKCPNAIDAIQARANKAARSAEALNREYNNV